MSGISSPKPSKCTWCRNSVFVFEWWHLGSCSRPIHPPKTACTEGTVVSILMSLELFFLSFFQVPVISWFDDVDDSELLNLLPLFEELSQANNVYTRLDQLRGQWSDDNGLSLTEPAWADGSVTQLRLLCQSLTVITVPSVINSLAF